MTPQAELAEYLYQNLPTEGGDATLAKIRDCFRRGRATQLAEAGNGMECIQEFATFLSEVSQGMDTYAEGDYSVWSTWNGFVG